MHAEVLSAFALPRSIGQAGFTVHRPSPTYSNFGYANLVPRMYIYMCIYFFVEASVCHTIMSKYVLALRSKRQACGVGCCRWKNAAQNGAWQKLPLALQKRCKEVPGWSSATGSHERVWPRFVFSLYVNMCATHVLCHWRASLGLRTQSFAHASANTDAR